MKWLRHAALPMTALALIGIGAAWLWSIAASMLIVGGLVWIDLNIPSGGRADGDT